MKYLVFLVFVVTFAIGCSDSNESKKAIVIDIDPDMALDNQDMGSGDIGTTTMPVGLGFSCTQTSDCADLTCSSELDFDSPTASCTRACDSLGVGTPACPDGFKCTREQSGPVRYCFVDEGAVVDVIFTDPSPEPEGVVLTLSEKRGNLDMPVLG